MELEVERGPPRVVAGRDELRGPLGIARRETEEIEERPNVVTKRDEKRVVVCEKAAGERRESDQKSERDHGRPRPAIREQGAKVDP
jgi:hypothetical protein